MNAGYDGGPSACATPGTTVATLQNLDVLRADFSVPEQSLNLVRIGQPVRFGVTDADMLRLVRTFMLHVKANSLDRQEVERRLTITRLGEGVDERRRLLPTAVARVRNDRRSSLVVGVLVVMKLLPGRAAGLEAPAAR